MNSLYQVAAKTATNNVRVIYGKDVDENLALQIIDNFCEAYKQKTRHSYTGGIDQTDVAKALNAATMNPARFTDPEAYKAYFERKDRATAERVRFGDCISALVSKTIAEHFGI